jgi:hypothetical protein
MTAMHRMNPRSWLTALLMSATLALAIVPSVAAAKPEPLSCSAFPGDTTVSWRGDKDLVSIHAEWFDAAGTPAGSWTFIITNGKPQDSQATPDTATFVHTTWNDSLGNVVTIDDDCL